MNIDYSLYYVTNQDSFNSDIEFYSFTEEVIKNGVTIVQLRYKKNFGKNFLETAINLKKITAKYNIPLIINDRIDIALLSGADGIHLGQSDIPLKYARQLLGEKSIIGISANRLQLAVDAEECGANYLGVGAIFNTNTKKDASLIATEEIIKISNAVNIPLVAIGGIGISTIPLIPNNIFSGIAVISDLQLSDNPKEQAKNILSLFNTIKKK